MMRLCLPLFALLAACAGEAGFPRAEDGAPPALDGAPALDAAPPALDREPPALDHALPPAQPDAKAPSPCAGQGTFFNGHCYLAIGYKWMDYAAASQLCAANQGKVASILSAAENTFVHGLLAPLNQAAWIGLRRNNGKFAWVDAQPVGYTNWSPGEPNNDKASEDCTVMWGPHLSITKWRGQWNDVPCDAPGRDTVICKRKP